jgi:hypothetical protein
MRTILNLCRPAAFQARPARPASFVAPALLVLALGVPASLVAQATPAPLELHGVVAEQGVNVAVPDAAVTLYRQDGSDGDLEPVASSVSDGNGRFVFTLPGPGVYRLAADLSGLSSPLSAPVRVAADETPDEVVLFLPSRLLMLAGTCDMDEQPGAVVVGLVLDQFSGVPLPGARVEARWTDPALGQREQLTESDGAGRFRVCGVAAPARLQLRAGMLGRSGGWGAIDIPRTAVVFHDLVFSLAETVTEDEAEVEFTEMARSLGDLTGVLLDGATGEPIGSALIRIRETSFQGVTGADGRFAFMDLLPGSYVLEVHHLGFAHPASRIDVPEGKDVRVTLRASLQAVELDGIEVVARAAAEQIIRTSPFRRYVVSGESLAIEETRGARVTDVLNARMTGLRVREHTSQGGPALCIETVRRLQRIQELDTVPDALNSTRDFGGARCDMVQVILDGARLGDGDGVQASHFLRAMLVSEVESLEYLPPTHGTLLYGMGGNVSNGVLVIYTRGKGPYRSASRDRPPSGDDR